MLKIGLILRVLVCDGDDFTVCYIVLYLVHGLAKHESHSKVCHNNGLMIQILLVINIRHDQKYFKHSDVMTRGDV